MTVYIKVMTRSGLWHGGLHLEDYELRGVTFGNLLRDKMEYHSKTKLHERADLMLVRVEDEPWPEGAYVAKR
jgi:hypothetical protein